LVLDQESALAHFNLGSVLDETGHVDAARQHLRQAVRLNPIYPDAHYNLAFVCEKLKAYAEAKQHWQAYVRLDPRVPGRVTRANAALLPRRQSPLEQPENPFRLQPAKQGRVSAGKGGSAKRFV